MALYSPAAVGVSGMDRTSSQPAMRMGLRFSPSGRFAVCLRVESTGLLIERWNLATEPARRDSCAFDGGPLTQVGIDDAGAITVAARTENGCALVHIPGGQFGPKPQPWSVVDAPWFELAEGTTGLAVSHHDGISTVYSLQPSLGAPSAIYAIEGLLKGGVPVDGDGRYVAFNQLRTDQPPRTVIIDLVERSSRPLLPNLAGHQLLLAQPDTGRLLLATGLPKQPQFASATLDQTTFLLGGLRPEDTLNNLGSVLPLALSKDGQSLYLAVERGVRSEIIHYDFPSGAQRPMAVPLGVVKGRGACTTRALHFPFSTLDEPLVVGTAPIETAGPATVGYRANGSVSSGACVEQFGTPHGSIEALVVGDHWTCSERVLVAIHGGPADHWRAEHSSLLRALAHSGITVIAVNQRGSTGYGPAHHEAIHHAWGGPDLVDIHCLSDHIASRRSDRPGKLMILGVSYGANLALLAASTQPERWSHCVAVAPFTSGERLYHHAIQPVKRMINRLGGRTEVRDKYGPRDLLVITKALTARTLIIHGADDPIIPVTHSRDLVAHLIGSGKSADVRYVEAPQGGHFPREDAEGRPILALITDFLKTKSL